MPTVEGSLIDLTQLLDRGRWSPFQKRLLVLAALAFAVDGLANQVLGLAVPALIRDWHVTRDAFAPAVALGLTGVALGAAIGGALGDRLGRAAGLTGSVLLFGLATAGMAACHGLTSLTVLRFAAGAGIGGAIPNGAALITEFTPLHRRSLAIALGMLFIPVGGVLAGLLSSLLLAAFGWRSLFLVSGALPVLLSLAFLAWLPESPRHLLRDQRRREELLRVLQRCGCAVDHSVAFVEDPPAPPRAPFAALFDHGLRNDTLALWLAFFSCLLASYTLFSWIPALLLGQGFALSMTSMGMTVFNVGGMVGSLVGGWLIGWRGSRGSVAGLAAGSTLGAIVLGVMPLDPRHGTALAAGALLIEGFFIGGLHNGLYTLAAFRYPPAVRATGVGAAAGIGRIGAIVSSYTGVLTLKLAGTAGYFALVAVATALAFLGTLLIRQHVVGQAATGSAPRPA
jgi:AAHS family 4-hydroxybenzoate transporter-like MFS transporter